LQILKNHSYVVDLNKSVVRKSEKRDLIESEPYFSDNCCFFEKPKKAYLAKRTIYGTILTPQKGLFRQKHKIHQSKN